MLFSNGATRWFSMLSFLVGYHIVSHQRAWPEMSSSSTIERHFVSKIENCQLRGYCVSRWLRLNYERRVSFIFWCWLTLLFVWALDSSFNGETKRCFFRRLTGIGLLVHKGSELDSCSDFLSCYSLVFTWPMILSTFCLWFRVIVEAWIWSYKKQPRPHRWSFVLVQLVTKHNARRTC